MRKLNKNFEASIDTVEAMVSVCNVACACATGYNCNCNSTADYGAYQYYPEKESYKERNFNYYIQFTGIV